MTYLITGKLVLKEKPENYLNTYVSLVEEKYVNGNYTHTNQDLKTTNLESLARKWKTSGRPVEFVHTLDRAKDFCKTETIEIDESKFLNPKQGWGSYLTKKYGTWNDQYTAIDGEIIVWKQTRFPLPWIYCYAEGIPAGYFTASNGTIFQPRTVQFTGTIKGTGLALDTRVINWQRLHTKKDTSKREFDNAPDEYGTVSCQVTETTSTETKRKFSFVNYGWQTIGQ